MRVLVLGPEGAADEERAFHAELARWLEDAPVQELESLVPAARAMGDRLDWTVAERLYEAASVRDVPTMESLYALAEKIDSDDLRAMMGDDSAEPA